MTITAEQFQGSLSLPESARLAILGQSIPAGPELRSTSPEEIGRQLVDSVKEKIDTDLILEFKRLGELIQEQEKEKKLDNAIGLASAASSLVPAVVGLIPNMPETPVKAAIVIIVIIQLAIYFLKVNR